MLSSKDFLFIWAGTSNVYLKWGIASIFTFYKAGVYFDSLLLVGNQREEEVAERARKLLKLDKLSIVKVNLSIEGNKLLFKPFSLNKLILEKESLLENYENIMYFDVDTVFYFFDKRFFSDIRDKFYVDKIYSKKAKVHHRKEIEEFSGDLKIELNNKIYQYNSGVWSIPVNEFKDVIFYWTSFIHTFQNKFGLSITNDQPFFTLAAYKCGLSPLLLKEYIAESNDHHIFHSFKTGFQHVYGGWREGKEEIDIYFRYWGAYRKMRKMFNSSNELINLLNSKFNLTYSLGKSVEKQMSYERRNLLERSGVKIRILIRILEAIIYKLFHEKNLL